MKVLKALALILICVAFVFSILSTVLTLHDRGLDARCREYVISQMGNDCIVSISRAESNSLPSGSYCWHVTVSSDNQYAILVVVYFVDEWYSYKLNEIGTTTDT